jgi:hypothetical protein
MVEKLSRDVYDITPPKFAYLGDFVTGDYADASHEAAFSSINRQG